MRLATLADRAVLLVEDGAVDIATASNGRFGTDPMELLADWAEFVAWATAAELADPRPYRPIDLTAPVPRPRQVFAVALNYRPHAAEAGYMAPEIPLLFTKFPSCPGSRPWCPGFPACDRAAHRVYSSRTNST
ncbi:fumarylacetoacetate hydrolase family protein, partial [Streptomyces sp. NPDC005070]